MRVVVTGGAGFIGSALIRFLVKETVAEVVNVDKLTYAANPEALAQVAASPRYSFVQADICERPAMRRVFDRHAPTAVVNLAAETHVDRSIDAPSAFIQTNIVGTHVLLETALEYWRGLTPRRQAEFRFLHVSTDEVYGSLGPKGYFTERTRYRPNSPYSASKASSDHLVRAWHQTYGLPCITSNCSNNYGPYQYPEKLIPLMIANGLLWEPLPVYGVGENIRDWLHVEDHARALWAILTRGRSGQTYIVGGNSELRNIEVVGMICDLLDEMAPSGTSRARRGLITMVEDRPGHDLRYAIDASKIGTELKWGPRETFASGLRKTVAWYIANRDWWSRILDDTDDGTRLGLGRALEAP